MRKTFTRLGVAAALTLGSAGVTAALGTLQAHAVGPEGCVAQGANGFVAAGTLTGTSAPAAPGPSTPGTCSFTSLSDQGGAGGSDSVSWSVTKVDKINTVDVTGAACGWSADPPPPPVGTQTYTISGTGQANVGYGCIAKGANGTVNVG